MKAIDLINALQLIVDKYGDLPVNHERDTICGPCPVSDPTVYTECGNPPIDIKDAKDIYLF